MRPGVAGGASTRTWKRYRAVFDKFLLFAQKRPIITWNEVDRTVLLDYNRHLVRLGKSAATQYLELTVLKQVLKWLVESQHLPQNCRVTLKVKKPQSNDVYCWQATEVAVMLQRCLDEPALSWLHPILATLAYTGLRISELASLRRSDLDFEQKFIQLTDERRNTRTQSSMGRRELKSGRNRSFPIHPDLCSKFRRPKMDSFFTVPWAGESEAGYDSPDPGTRCSSTVGREIPEAHRLRSRILRWPPAFIQPFFCSVCASSGQVSEQTLMSWLCHQNSRMIRHYFHLHNLESQRQMGHVEILPKQEAR